ncbi:MAG: SDR family NAD(P)-dependent oxidoreductase, partial [Myxococcota bacterium]
MAARVGRLRALPCRLGARSLETHGLCGGDDGRCAGRRVAASGLVGETVGQCGRGGGVALDGRAVPDGEGLGVAVEQHRCVVGLRTLELLLAEAGADERGRRDVAALLVVRERLVDAGRGRVINIGSIEGYTLPMHPGSFAYPASKAAVHHLTRTLARELA